jgi:O-antigen ligase
MLYVYKSMLNRLQNEWRSHIIFGLAVLMLAGLFLPRAVISLTMAAFLIACLADTSFFIYLRRFFSSPLLWGMSLLFFLPLLTGFWSEDKAKWMEMIRIKLPLFLLPLAFAGNCKLSEKQYDWLALLLVLLVTGGTAWSMFHYIQDVTEVNEGYLKAKSLLTPLANDRIRFSWLVSAAILTAGWLSIKKVKENKPVAILLLVILLWLGVYLHILAVRTGLLSFYIILLMTVAWLIIQKINKSYMLAIIAILILFPLAAYFTLPTFQNRIKYIRYESGYFEKTHYLPGANDAVRVISLKAGWNMMMKNPLTGVGFGDVPAEAINWYDLHYPQMKTEDKIYPASEWLMYGAGGGIAGFILFTIAMIIPFFIRVTNKWPWYTLNTIAAFGFLFDIGLEMQFGVFIYAFIILWWWKWVEFPQRHEGH